MIHVIVPVIGIIVGFVIARAIILCCVVDDLNERLFNLAVRLEKLEQEVLK